MAHSRNRTTGSPHAHSTRFVHAGLAISVMVQLGTSLIMEGPNGNSAGDIFFQIHKWTGLSAMTFALLFWATLGLRKQGTEIGALFPCFSGTRRQAFVEDLLLHIKTGLRFRLPPFDEDSALAAGIHGLGLLLMTALAASGTAYLLLVWNGIYPADPDDVPVMVIHFTLGNVGWVYLIGHAALGVLHHLRGVASLGRMWSFRK